MTITERFGQRILDKTCLHLIARTDTSVLGFKSGYALAEPDTDCFYSYLGGVAPDCRRQGIATALLDRMVAWARDHGYRRLRCATRNKHRGMLHFLIRHGFAIVAVEPRGEVWEHDRIVCELIFSEAVRSPRPHAGPA